MKSWTRRQMKKQREVVRLKIHSVSKASRTCWVREKEVSRLGVWSKRQEKVAIKAKWECSGVAGILSLGRPWVFHLEVLICLPDLRIGAGNGFLRNRGYITTRSCCSRFQRDICIVVMTYQKLDESMTESYKQVVPSVKRYECFQAKLT